jgi:hypothetical protein
VVPDRTVGLRHPAKSPVLGQRRIAGRIVKVNPATLDIEVLDSDGYDPYTAGERLRRKKSKINPNVMGGAAVL